LQLFEKNENRTKTGITIDDVRFFFSFHFYEHQPEGLSAWEEKLDEVEDTDGAGVGEWAKDDFMVVF